MKMDAADCKAKCDADTRCIFALHDADFQLPGGSNAGPKCWLYESQRTSAQSSDSAHASYTCFSKEPPTWNWKLLIRQTTPFYQAASSWLSYNNGNTENDNYSILNTLGDSDKKDGKFHFRLIWPAKAGNNMMEWKQTTNPVTETTASVSGYEAVTIPYTSNRWAGLESGFKHGGSSPSAILDGSVNHGNWYYAVGSKSAWNGGIPGASSAESEVELWVHSSA